MLLMASYHIKSCLVAAILGLASLASSQEDAGKNGLWPVQSFRSSSLQVPYLNVTKRGATELGSLFIAPRDKIRGTRHAAIYQDDGQLVWASLNGTMLTLEPQTLDGEPVLVYWDGLANSTGFGIGYIGILNSSYEQIYNVTLDGDENFNTIYEGRKFPSYIDVHESTLTDQGSVLVTAVNVTRADLQSVGGPEDGWVMGGLFYEIDIKTNKILFRWSGMDHLDEAPFTLSRNPLFGSGKTQRNAWNYIHVNSVAKYDDGYLLSSRYMCSVFFIAPNGTTKWRLDGVTGGDFDLGPGTSFCYQHDVRFGSQTPDKATLHIHNNANTEFTDKTQMTTGLVLELDLKTMKVSLLRKLWNPEQPVFAVSQGSYQQLNNSHVLLGHGASAVIEEYDESGALVMDARFGYDYSMPSYRAYRMPWVGRPRTLPCVYACRDSKAGNVKVMVSWNGATDVEYWNAYAGKDQTLEISARKNGFETTIVLSSDVDEVVVEAVGGPNGGRKSDAVKVVDCA